jgi:hypothetical protein
VTFGDMAFMPSQISIRHLLQELKGGTCTLGHDDVIILLVLRNENKLETVRSPMSRLGNLNTFILRTIYVV